MTSRSNSKNCKLNLNNSPCKFDSKCPHNYSCLNRIHCPNMYTANIRSVGKIYPHPGGLKHPSDHTVHVWGSNVSDHAERFTLSIMIMLKYSQ